MNSRVAECLAAINRRFYSDFAAEFDVTRRSPWPGWSRVLEHVEQVHEVSILDVGCGNGRFGRFVEVELGRPVHYVGIDSSDALLRAARKGGGERWSLIEHDLFAEPWPSEVEGCSFDLVVCFGVMHHVPGESSRRSLLWRMGNRVDSGGCLAVSFWQFGLDPRFRGRTVPWAEVGLGEADEAELEPGDHLLRWGEPGDVGAGASDSVRYCHHCDPQEAERLTASLDLRRADTFVSDGRRGDLNLYHLLVRA